MALILPYVDNLVESEGCYITEDGQFVVTGSKHAEYATRHFLGQPFFTEYFKMCDNDPKCISRFPICIYNWDKLSTLEGKVIESSTPIPNIRFHNLILMGFEIKFVQPLVYNPQASSFVDRQTDNSLSSLNKEYGERIERIKTKVLLPDRKKFLLDRMN